jgi:3-oxoacyl-[acyl-carrier-protein] synthase-3
MTNVAIIGTGHHVPERVVTNEELKQWMDTSDEWIRERSGIAERRWVEPGTSTDDMALAASRMALEAAGIEASELDMILFATINPDHFFPGNGVLLQKSLGVDTIGAMDIRNQCTGFVYGMATGASYIKSGLCRTVLVVGAELQSSSLDLSDRGRDISVLFGDGAGAAILQATDSDSDVIASSLHSQGENAEELWCELPSGCLPGRITPELMAEGRHYPHMNGRTVFKNAVVRFCQAIDEVLEKGGVARDQVKLVVPHQANLRITEAVAKRFQLGPEQVFSNIQRYGNTTAASIPIALSEAVLEGRLERGDLLVLVAFGSGFTWGANLIRW